VREVGGSITMKSHTRETSFSMEKAMKNFFWAIFFLITVGVAASVSQGYWQLTPTLVVTLGLFYAIHPIGALWMVYQCLRYEKSPFPLLLLCLVPYSFVWYYFERVRAGKQTLRAEAGGAPLAR